MGLQQKSKCTRKDWQGLFKRYASSWQIVADKVRNVKVVRLF